MSEKKVVLTKLICLQSVEGAGSWESVRATIFEKARSFSSGILVLYFPTHYQGVPSELEERGDAVEDYMVGLIEEGLVSGTAKQLQITPKGRQLKANLFAQAEEQGWIGQG